MLKLSSNSVFPLGSVSEPQVAIRRITDDPAYPISSRAKEYYLVRRQNEHIPAGFGGYLFFDKPVFPPPENSFLLEHDLSYIEAGDILKISPSRHSLRILYRRNSPHNFVLVTERCNNLCLMCSQPPRKIDDSHLVDEIIQTISLMSPDTGCVGITGGEPTLLDERLIEIVQSLRNVLPNTAVHILSNGRRFVEWGYADGVAKVDHPNLMIGIPVYSDDSSIHDYVVQADGAFDDTIRGIINLKSVGIRVEIRVVVHKITHKRLPELARFIRRNLTFCDHVAFMGLEMTGFTPHNIDKLWIDPKDYQQQLVEATVVLDRARIPVSIYNHQLCVLDPVLLPFYRKSISDWKNEYMPECGGCVRKGDCGGFFSSARLRYSEHISPFIIK